MAIQQSQSPLVVPHHIEVWRNECTKAVKQNPGSQSDLFLQLALNELHNMYVQGTSNDSRSPLVRRQDIYNYFKEAGKSGHARGMFFEGLALLGFGCQADPITSQALIRVSAFARNCDLALQYLTLRLGQSHLYGTNGVQNLTAAVKCFKQAGNIADPELRLIAQHLDKMRAKFAQNKQGLVLEEAPKVVNVAPLRLTF